MVLTSKIDIFKVICQLANADAVMLNLLETVKVFNRISMVFDIYMSFLPVRAYQQTIIYTFLTSTLCAYLSGPWILILVFECFTTLPGFI